jgi:membrane protein YdbS with pleckstrin-like domain
MKNTDMKLQVTHVNIRLSIVFLLLKLLLIEIISATGVVIFLSVALTEFISQLGFELPIVSIPIYIILVAVKIFLTVFVMLQWLNEYYEITSELITHRKGIFFRHEEKYPMEHMRIVEFNQGIFGKLFNFGTISLLDPIRIERIDLYQVHNPVRYAKILEDQLSDEVEKIDIFRRHISEPEDRTLSVN